MRSFIEHNPLEKRVFKVRNPATNFYCPLCSTERAFTCRPKLTHFHYLQMSFLTLLVFALAYPYAGGKSLPIFFVFWAVFDIGIRLRFKREIPCPHCGFDATWYKRDVKVARRKVKEFWDLKNKKVPEEVSPEVTT